ncbi:MAG: prephenate dehydrogenase/arogenate dehydrogenase family protein [Deltaproteobacteria bacterium]|nr:prephenate dehydrogenase/arogenate dehydrogenase family protein [Deltaproteobacteria bacterium]MBN2688545.1 prephenate dehydrogenase/arogenate dehydrogenase family protein [Deltaproteobacteria bacterium]
MSDCVIGIIGGTGGIGRWFSRFFAEEGFTVHVSGRNNGMGIEEMASACHVVIVSVPIGATEGVIRAVGPVMPRESLLMDFTSLKREPVACMLEASRSEVMGCHPLFGPDVSSMRGLNIILCPARVDRWMNWAHHIFERAGAVVTEATPDEHDRFMAVVQGLNHFNTMMMGLAVKDSGLDNSALKRFTTPLFDAKMSIVEKVLTGNMRLYMEIITHNDHFMKMLALYERNIAAARECMEHHDVERLAELFEKKYATLYEEV